MFYDDREDVCALLTDHGILAMRVSRKDKRSDFGRNGSDDRSVGLDPEADGVNVDEAVFAYERVDAIIDPAGL